MITNPQDYIFYSDFQYPPRISAGSTDVAAGDYNLKVLTSGVTLDHDYVVYQQRKLPSGETTIQKVTGAYIAPGGDLVAQPTAAPSKLIWRVYGY